MVVNLRIFLIGAIVLIVFAIIAASHGIAGTFASTTALTWVAAALLSYFVDLMVPISLGTIGSAPPPR